MFANVDLIQATAGTGTAATWQSSEVGKPGAWREETQNENLEDEFLERFQSRGVG